MIQVKATLLVLVFAFTGTLWAEEIKYKPLEMAVDTGDALFIEGFEGNVSFYPKKKARSLKIFVKQTNPERAPQFAKELWEEWMFVMDKKAHKISLKVKGPSSKKSWAPLLRQKGFPRFDLKIVGPPIPVKVSWWQGKVVLKGWKSRVQVTLNQGQVDVSEGEGILKIFGQKGRIMVSKHKGSMVIGSYSSKVDIRESEGEIEVENFAGTTRIRQVKGAVKYQGFKGRLNLWKSEGQFEFKNGQASIKLVEFHGEIRGRTAQGPVSLDLVGETRVDVRSKEGDVSLRLKNSGAQVNLGSKEGGIYAPSYLRPTQYATLKVRQGRLRGRQTGRVFVRTLSGAIRLR